MIEGSLNCYRLGIITRQKARLRRTEGDRELMSRSESGRSKKKTTARKIHSYLFYFLQLQLSSLKCLWQICHCVGSHRDSVIAGFLYFHPIIWLQHQWYFIFWHKHIELICTSCRKVLMNVSYTCREKCNKFKELWSTLSGGGIYELLKMSTGCSATVYKCYIWMVIVLLMYKHGENCMMVDLNIVLVRPIRTSAAGQHLRPKARVWTTSTPRDTQDRGNIIEKSKICCHYKTSKKFRSPVQIIEWNFVQFNFIVGLQAEDWQIHDVIQHDMIKSCTTKLHNI